MIRIFVPMLLLLSCFALGCESEPLTSPSSQPSSSFSVGTWTLADPEYDRLHDAIIKADAIIVLGPDSSIEIYDTSSNDWQDVASMEQLRKRLESVSGRSLISIGTQRAISPTSEESELIQQITDAASDLGFATIVVTQDHSEAEEITLEITQVIDLAK